MVREEDKDEGYYKLVRERNFCYQDKLKIETEKKKIDENVTSLEDAIEKIEKLLEDLEGRRERLGEYYNEDIIPFMRGNIREKMFDLQNPGLVEPMKEAKDNIEEYILDRMKIKLKEYRSQSGKYEGMIERFRKNLERLNTCIDNYQPL